MLLDLSKLHGAREHFERTFQPAAFPQDEDYRVAAPVTVSLDVEKVGKGIFRVIGHAATTLELECGRCVEPFEMPIDARWELRYAPAAVATAEPDREITEDDLTTAFYRDESLDVIEMLGEQIQLLLPMKPLCAESCRGLCPECGANLNRTECGCQPRWEDPRLAPLKGLLNRIKES
ncbi:MAG: DUF177 domain-containing protein [Acidobacteriota bacterium]